MRIRQFMLCPALAMGLLMTPHLAGTAGAAPPAEVSGTYTAQLTGGTLPEGRGNATFFEFSNAVVISGDIQATGGSDFRCVQVDQSFIRCQGEQVVTGTITGIDGEGTFVIRVLLTCDLATGQCSGKSTSISGTGAWDDLHLRTRSQNLLVGPGGTYSGTLVAQGR